MLCVLFLSIQRAQLQVVFFLFDVNHQMTSLGLGAKRNPVLIKPPICYLTCPFALKGYGKSLAHSRNPDRQF